VSLVEFPPPRERLAGQSRELSCPRQCAWRVLQFSFDSVAIFRGYMECSAMAQAKQASKRKRQLKALPAFGVAGVSLAVAGTASATAPTANIPSQEAAPRPIITLGEEEISDVSLATFYVFDRENARTPQAGTQYAWGCRGCRGCGCRACRACRGCGCGGCGCSCCASWGACRWC
jgi:hypothetical protein